MYRNMFKLFKVSAPIIPLIVLPYTIKSYEAFFWSKKQANTM